VGIKKSQGQNNLRGWEKISERCKARKAGLILMTISCREFVHGPGNLLPCPAGKPFLYLQRPKPGISPRISTPQMPRFLGGMIFLRPFSLLPEHYVSLPAVQGNFHFSTRKSKTRVNTDLERGRILKRTPTRALSFSFQGQATPLEGGRGSTTAAELARLTPSEEGAGEGAAKTSPNGSNDHMTTIAPKNKVTRPTPVSAKVAPP